MIEILIKYNTSRCQCTQLEALQDVIEQRSAVLKHRQVKLTRITCNGLGHNEGGEANVTLNNLELNRSSAAWPGLYSGGCRRPGRRHYEGIPTRLQDFGGAVGGPRGAGEGAVGAARYWNRCRERCSNKLMEGAARGVSESGTDEPDGRPVPGGYLAHRKRVSSRPDANKE